MQDNKNAHTGRKKVNQMRKWLRCMARAKMRRLGFAHINRKGGDGKSFFAKHWREYA